MIIFVRHGETDLNRRGVLQGRVDVPLNATGRAQAEQLALALRAVPAVRVISSPLARAVATADPIAAVLDLPVVIDERLTEIHYGEWDTMPFADARALAGPHWESDPHFAPPGGESLHAVVERVAAVCSAFGPAPGDSAAVTIAVSHVSPIKGAVTTALGVGPTTAWSMRLDLASITRVGWHADGLVLRSFNETAHLAD